VWWRTTATVVVSAATAATITATITTALTAALTRRLRVAASEFCLFDSHNAPHHFPITLARNRSICLAVIRKAHKSEPASTPGRAVSWNEDIANFPVLIKDRAQVFSRHGVWEVVDLQRNKMVNSRRWSTRHDK